MGSISGFKEYVDKDHPACPLCGGATNKAKLTLSGNLLKLAKTLPSPNAYQGEDVLDLEELSRQRKRMIGEQNLPRGLGDFFFEPDDPLHPDR